MNAQDILSSSAGLLAQKGRLALNLMYPNEFEVYMCAFELIDHSGATLKYFIFPVMPSNIEETHSEITNIKKTLAGVVVLSNNTFIPRDISLSGTFGRKFRTLIGENIIDLTSSFMVDNKLTIGSVASGIKQMFSDRVKTGYGCYKVLEEMIDESKVIDEKGARRLLFYNPSIGNNYIVKPISLKASMSQESNMLWNYSLSLKAIAPLEALQTEKEKMDQRAMLSASGHIQSQLQNTINSLSSILL